MAIRQRLNPETAATSRKALADTISSAVNGVNKELTKARVSARQTSLQKAVAELGNTQVVKDLQALDGAAITKALNLSEWLIERVDDIAVP